MAKERPGSWAIKRDDVTAPSLIVAGNVAMATPFARLLPRYLFDVLQHTRARAIGVSITPVLLA